MTFEEYCKENPEAAAALLAEAQAVSTEAAVRAERQRMSDIDAVSALYEKDIVNAAKYGEHACTAQEMCYRAAVESAKQGKTFMANMSADHAESGAGDVAPAPAPEETGKHTTNADLLAAGKAAAANAKKKEA